MARLFFHKPQFAVLDQVRYFQSSNVSMVASLLTPLFVQCTDAVSVDVEEELYQYANSLNITIITISQRPGLLKLHSQELRLLDGKGNWDLSHINLSLP